MSDGQINSWLYIPCKPHKAPKPHESDVKEQKKLLIMDWNTQWL